MNNPTDNPTSEQPLTPLELAAFWSRVEVGTPFQCWPWKGAKRDGYGRFQLRQCHRISYELINGPIPEGLLVRHRCDNPPCCNPAHLLTGTHLDNMQDAVERDRIARGKNAGNSKLLPEQVDEIRRNPDRLTGRALAKKFGVGEATVSMIRSGKIWSEKTIASQRSALPTAREIAR